MNKFWLSLSALACVLLAPTLAQAAIDPYTSGDHWHPGHYGAYAHSGRYHLLRSRLPYRRDSRIFHVDHHYKHWLKRAGYTQHAIGGGRSYLSRGRRYPIFTAAKPYYLDETEQPAYRYRGLKPYYRTILHDL